MSRNDKQPIKMTLRFSIIVPTLDRREMLQAALASIRAQAWPDTDIIGVLNSDDLYEPDAFSAVGAAFAADPTAAAVCGTAILFEEERILAEFNRDSDKALSSP